MTRTESDLSHEALDLLGYLPDWTQGKAQSLLREALAAERRIVEAECDERIIVVRRATVERIREKLLLREGLPIPEDYAERVLDEEAAR